MLEPVSLFLYLKTGLVVGIAALIHGSVGIGFPLVATPLLATFLDVRTAILLLVIPTVANNLANVIKGGKWQLSIGTYWPLALYGMIGSFIGAHLLISAPADFFRPILALMLVLYLNAERLGVRFPWITRYPGSSMAIFGVGAGIVGGTVNVMLPVLVIYALEMKMPKSVMIQVFNFCFLLGKFTQGAVFFRAGLFTADIVMLALPLAVFALGVMYFGMQVREKINETTYRRWLRRLLSAMAVVLIIQSIIGTI